MLGDITTALAKTHARVDSLAVHMVTPGATPATQASRSHVTADRGPPIPATIDEHEQFHGLEERVCC